MEVAASVSAGPVNPGESNEYQRENFGYKDAFNDRVMLLLKQNDPDTRNLSVSWSVDSFASSVDWDNEAASFFGNSTHLMSLEIRDLPSRRVLEDNDMANNFYAFIKGLATNQSIKRLVLHGCHLDDNEVFSRLSAFFEHNPNIQCVNIIKCKMTVEGAASLAASLAKCHQRALREVRFWPLTGRNRFSCTVSSYTVSNFVAGLNTHKSLAVINLCGAHLNAQSCTLLAGIMGEYASVNELNLMFSGLNDTTIAILAAPLISSTSLKKLSMYGNYRISSAGWQTLFPILKSANSVLEILEIDNTCLSNTGALSFANNFSDNNTLKVLNNWGWVGREPPSIGTSDWGALLSALLSVNSPLEELNLSSNGITDAKLAILSNALTNNPRLKVLDLGGNTSVTVEGWRDFLRVVNNTNCLMSLGLSGLRLNPMDVALHIFIRESRLEKIDIAGNQINREVAMSFAEALSGNANLKSLIIADNRFDSYVFSQLLCNASSIDSIVSSNHVLMQLEAYPRNKKQQKTSVSRIFGKRGYTKAVFDSLLQMNANENKSEVIRQKILQCYFLDGDANVQELEDMELNVLPQVICWLGRDSMGLPVLFQWLKRSPLLINPINSHAASC